MTDTTTPKRRTITLTDRPPVKIREEDWPVIARGAANDNDAENPGNPPNRTWTRTIRVCQHDDGRVIVYGFYHFSTAHQSENDAVARCGDLLATPPTTAAIIARIRGIATDLATAEREAAIDERHREAGRWRAVAQACIADLPAEEL